MMMPQSIHNKYQNGSPPTTTTRNDDNELDRSYFYNNHYDSSEMDQFMSYHQLNGLSNGETPANILIDGGGGGTTINPQHTIESNSNIVHDILYDQELCRAGVLFSLSNEMLLSDFPLTIEILKKIIDNKSYASNVNQQSIVEIVLTKCITALKETRLILNYYEDLLELLEICLKYNLNNSSPNRNSYRFSALSDSFDKERQQHQPFIIASTPHANIVSDILSCILLDYLDPELSEKAIPVCVKLLQHHNIKPDLVKEICSYLNLVACRSSELLVDYVYYILNAILKGHTLLTQLLYQICESQPECIYPLVKHLVKALKLIESTNDLVYILQIMYLISLNHVHLVIVHLEDLIGFIGDDSCQDVVLDILFSIANQSPIALEPYMVLLENPQFNDSHKVDKIIGTVGKSLRKMSEYCTNLLIQRIRHARNKSIKMVSLSKRLNSCRKVNDDAENESSEASIERSTATRHSSRTAGPTTTTQASNGSNRNSYSKSYSYSYNYNNSNSSSLVNSNRNLESLANMVVIDEQKRYLQILNEIYEIAQVFPNVLDIYYKKLNELLPNPSDNVAYMLQKIKQSKSENSSIVMSKDDLDVSNEKFSESTQLRSNKEEDENSVVDSIEKVSNLQMSNLEIIENEHKQNSSIVRVSGGEQLTENKIAEIINKYDLKLKLSDKSNVELHIVEEKDEMHETLAAFPPTLFTSNKSDHEINDVKDDQLLIEEKSVVSSTSPAKYSYQSGFLNMRIIEEEGNESTTTATNINSAKVNNDGTVIRDVNTITHHSFLNGLRRHMEHTGHPISSTVRIHTEGTINRDIIENFCSKHIEKIRIYIRNVEKLLPMPIIDPSYDNSALNRTLITDSTKTKAKSKKLSLKFACNSRSEHCLFSSNFFEIITSFPTTWIHLIFLAIQANTPYALRQQHPAFVEMKVAYDFLNEKTSFVALLTSSFPSEKQINELRKELAEFRVYDLFEHQSTSGDSCDGRIPIYEYSSHSIVNSEWPCYMCANPEKVKQFLEHKPLIQGEFNEKHGKWKFLKRWRRRFFTLTGGSIVYFKKDMRQESLNVRYIRNIQTVKKTTKSKRNIIKAFEIFTDNNSFVLKPVNSSQGEEWLRYLQLFKVLENNKYNPIDENSVFIKTTF